MIFKATPLQGAYVVGCEPAGDSRGFFSEVYNRRTFAEAGIRAEITGRPKHIYSIWRKMQRKRVGIEQVFDISAVRVLVDTIPECYAVLGQVHSLGRGDGDVGVLHHHQDGQSP